MKARGVRRKYFRELVEEVSMLMAYEVTRDLETEEVEVETPICKTKCQMLAGKKIAIVPILRAGLGMVDGILNLIPAAKVGHIGLYRDEETLQPVEYFCKLPQDIAERDIIVVDPMLATGGSAADAISLLKKRGIKHQVLNAKYHAQEAEIISHAGELGMVTIATNMAGRGTDIKLGEGVREVGGLKVLGTERHESRRIDNQLRGRSGRQGDVGESKFYISLEDDIMRLFASEKLMSIFNALGVPENEEIHHKSLTKTIERAQKKIEGNNFGIRKNLMEYDKVNNDQREIIYAERARVLNGENMRDAIIKMMNEVIESQVDMFVGDDQETKDWDVAGLSQSLFEIIPVKLEIPKSEIEHLSKAEFKQLLKEAAVKLYEAKEAEFPEPEHIRELERIVLLRVIDRKWMDHLDDMEQLKQGIGLMAYGQRDPAVEYKIQGFEMFNDMIEGIKVETVKTLYHIQVEQKVEREEVAEVTGTNKDDTGVSKTKHRESEKIYPNDPCPCGSGKKYKNCCGRKA